MIRHDTIRAKRARINEQGGPGCFVIFEDDRGLFSVYEGAFCHECEGSSLQDATETARKAADAFDGRALEELKRNWRNDPVWDIEDTEGYEDIRQELYVYRLETELAAAKNEIERLHRILRPFSALLHDLHL